MHNNVKYSQVQRDTMDKRTVFAVTFFLLSLIILVMAYEGAPEHYGGSKYQTPSPKNVKIGNINFTVTAGFFEDDNHQKIDLPDSVSGHVVDKHQKSFRQNDILLLDIAVFELDGHIDLKDLNDGTFTKKSINDVEGIFKTSEVTTSTGIVENSHPRYYFNYIKDNNLVMVQCDSLKTIEGMLS